MDSTFAKEPPRGTFGAIAHLGEVTNKRVEITYTPLSGEWEVVLPPQRASSQHISIALNEVTARTLEDLREQANTNKEALANINWTIVHLGGAPC